MTDVFVWTGNGRGRCESCGTIQPLAVLVLADDEQDTGPPTDADFDWYVAHVMAVQDRPPAVNRQPEPMDGQLPMFGLDGSLTKMSEPCASCGMELRECLLLAATPMDETPPDCCGDCSHYPDGR